MADIILLHYIYFFNLKDSLYKAEFIWQNTVKQYNFETLQFKTTAFYFNIFYTAMAKLNFQQPDYSSLQCHMIHQKLFKYAEFVLKKQLSVQC